MVRKLNRKERRLIIRILRVILIALGGLIVFLLLLTAYLFVDRDNISKRLLLSTNNYTQGELSFESLTFNPFRQFPNISMLIRDVEYYENPQDRRNQNEKPLASFGKLYAAINVKRLISGNVDVKNVILNDGKIHLIQYPDSSLNLINSIELVDPPTEKRRNRGKDSLVLPASVRNVQADTLESTVFEVNLDRVFLKNVSFEYENRVDESSASLDIDRLEASLEHTSDAIRSKLDTEIRIHSLLLEGIKRVGSSNLKLETSLAFNLDDLSLVIDPSMLMLDKARLNIEGDLNFSGEGSINLVMDGSDEDFSFFSIFMSKTGLKNIEQGDLYFRGTIKNNKLRGLPQVDASFGLEKLRIHIPRTSKYINDLNLSGRFHTGKRADLSAAWVRLDTIYGELPDGFLNGKISVRNFKSPVMDLDWLSKANFSGFDQVFEVPFIDSLEGVIEILIHADGSKYYPDAGMISGDFFEAKLDFENASVNFPGVMSIESIDGRIQHMNGVTSFHDFSVDVDDSDFFINGNITNTLHIPFNVDTVVTADLEIQSEMFDLPGFLDFVPVFPDAFPYRIKDVDLGVSVSTSTRRFLDMTPNPSMTFDIKHLSAEIENLLPPLLISQGLFDLHHKNERTYLNFEDFKINIVESDLEVDLEFNSPAKKRNRLTMNVGVENLNPGKLIWSGESDTLPEFLDGIMDGSFWLDLHFPYDSTQTFKKIDLREADLLFINASDTVQTQNLHILAEDIYIDSEKDPNPFASLTADMTLGSDKSRLNSRSWVVYDFDVQAHNGIYSVIPGKSRLFGKEGRGRYTLDPFAETPNFHVKYQVDQYDVKDLMGNFVQDSLILGKMDLKIDVSLDIIEDQHIMSGLNGDILLKGEDLTLYGIELDKLIRRFERSQNFNLVDLGAVMFLGPAGLAISKGGSYANILVTDYSSNSHIQKLVSELRVDSGRVLLKDLAFSTVENRVAAKGWIDLPKDSLDAVFAVVDQNGCSIIEQRMYGILKEPEKSNIRFLETILAPLTNLWQSATGNDCKVFYEGSVSHPVNKKQSR